MGNTAGATVPGVDPAPAVAVEKEGEMTELTKVDTELTKVDAAPEKMGSRTEAKRIKYAQ